MPGGDDGDERALATRPSGPPPKLEFAESIARQRPGQVMLLGKDGNVIGRRELRARQAVAVATSAMIVVSAGIILGAPAAIGGAIGGVGMVLYRRYRYAKVRRGLALLVAWRDDEARAVLLEVQRGRVGRQLRGELERMLGVLAWRRGEHQVALEHVDRAIALGKGGASSPLHTVTRMSLLAEVDVDRAKASMGELDALPATEFYINERRYLTLKIAFHRDRPDELPDDLELHDWATSALGDNLAGWRIGLLAWAFDRRGDREMSELLLREVEAHLPVSLARIAPMTPRLHAWLAPRIAALPEED